MEAGDFRADLFYRLNILPIVLPPLRDRREDIFPLVQFMIRKFNVQHKRDIQTIEEQALMSLRAYQWPGNIRELENVIEHAYSRTFYDNHWPATSIYRKYTAS